MPSCRLFLCGDVMTGRGIDQILEHPSKPRLFESCVKDARTYVQLAEAANGSIPYPAPMHYIWGDCLDALDRLKVDFRLANLETSVTHSDDYWQGKGINYRMNPQNIGCLTAAKLDCCVLANNHVLDWGYSGLYETLGSLEAAGISTCGAGHNLEDAKRPAILQNDHCGMRVLVYAYASECSGVPREWAATNSRAGVNFLNSLSDRSIHRVIEDIQQYRNADGKDLVIISIHWGDNWGYRVPREQQQFARGLCDSGLVDIVFGHSSHHPRRWEKYGQSLILYGCGDFINDYEGISGKEWYRPDLTLMYIVDCKQTTDGDKSLDLSVVPMIRNQFHLRRGTDEDLKWLMGRLDPNAWQ